MFAVVSAFPKSLHCTDEAQQAETALSAVLRIIIIIIIIIFYRKPHAVYKLQKDVCHKLWRALLLLLLLLFYRKLHAVYITIDGCHYVWQKAQTAISHFTRGPAD